MQCIIMDSIMSFDFSNINPIRTEATYKDGGGLGGGGMYMRQKRKRKDEEEEDIFERSEEKDPNEIELVSEEIKAQDIPDSTMFNKFVNWFRIGRD